MSKYLIKWGVGGGYGGIMYASVIEAENLQEALTLAENNSREECESYGIGDDPEEFYGEEANDLDSDELEQIINEEIESWLDYEAELWTGSSKQVKDLENYWNSD